MKITKQQLKQIIKEEMGKVLKENSFEFAGGQIVVNEDSVELLGRDGNPAATKSGNPAIIPMEIASNYDNLAAWLLNNLALDEDGVGIEGTNIDGWGQWNIADTIEEALSDPDTDEDGPGWDPYADDGDDYHQDWKPGQRW